MRNSILSYLSIKTDRRKIIIILYSEIKLIGIYINHNLANNRIP